GSGAPGAHHESSSLNATYRVGASWTPTLRPAAPRLRESRTTSWTTGYRCSPVAGGREALSTTITGGAGRSLPSRVSVRASSAGRSRVAMTTLTAPARSRARSSDPGPGTPRDAIAMPATRYRPVHARRGRLDRDQSRHQRPLLIDRCPRATLLGDAQTPPPFPR